MRICGVRSSYSGRGRLADAVAPPRPAMKGLPGHCCQVLQDFESNLKQIGSRFKSDSIYPLLYKHIDNIINISQWWWVKKGQKLSHYIILHSNCACKNVKAFLWLLLGKSLGGRKPAIFFIQYFFGKINFFCRTLGHLATGVGRGKEKGGITCC